MGGGKETTGKASQKIRVAENTSGSAAKSLKIENVDEETTNVQPPPNLQVQRGQRFNTTSAQHSQNQPEIVNLVRAWYSLLAALFMELGFVEVATRHAPRTCPRLQ